ncbi:MAG: HAMP domain-containing histidine kinase [Candidatus Zixiibacteriota bacterium]|nr:MAG: HAMP domain-containing histidine kinase [candidate division Zixibacteria bacterium]
MIKPNPMRFHFVLFLILSIVAIAQLSWWVIFQVKEGDRITSHQQSIWNQQKKVAWTHFENTGFTDTEKSSWLKANFPDLELDNENRNLIITPEASQRLNELAQKRVRMFVSEGAFFSLLVFSGVWFFYWALCKRVELESKIENILSSAASSLKNPINSIKEDLDAISGSSQSELAQNKLLSRISSNIQKIADTCESVTLIKMLAASKRKIELELTDISNTLESVINDYKNSHTKSDLRINSDIERNLTAVTNPPQLSRIFQGALRVADNYAAEKDDIGVRLSKELNSGILNMRWKPSMKSKDINIVCNRIESELGIIRELAETIGVKIKVKTEDENSVCVAAELPLLEE